MTGYQIRLNLKDALLRHRSPRVLYLRLRYQCTHLGPAVKGCFCDPNRRNR